jgi:uncharacterized membrane protein
MEDTHHSERPQAARSEAKPSEVERGGRLVAIDWLRGFVMMVMAVDHASVMFNAGRVAVDSMYPVDAFFVPAWIPGTDLPAAQFWTRWITHLCAPTFLFLSGTSLALSTAGRATRGMSAASIDRHLVVRGLVLIAIEALWLSIGPSLGAGRYILVLQVLYAIGLSLCAMALLRRLPARWLVALALAWLVGGEAVTRALAPVGDVGPLDAFLFAPGGLGFAAVAYPLAPWLAMMMLGWAFGASLLALRARGRPASVAAGRCAIAGLASLAVFGVVRGANAYGNLGLLRDDGTLVQWLHVSKYPPSLAFGALELGLMALALAALLWLEDRLTAPQRPRNPFRVLGRTALFFYVLHFPLLMAGAIALGRLGEGGILDTWLAASAVVAMMYPACIAYGRYKSAHPRGWAQYL